MYSLNFLKKLEDSITIVIGPSMVVIITTATKHFEISIIDFVSKFIFEDLMCLPLSYSLSYISYLSPIEFED